MMKLGLQINRFDWPGSPANTGPKLAEIARTADQAGFASLWVMDHLFQMDVASWGLAAADPMLDGYTALSYMAAVTQRARLGTLVTAVTYRHPGHLLKVVTNLDVLSRGRAILGIGAGWYAREAAGLGLPFPPLAERFERLEETLQIAKLMWSGEAQPFHGKQYRLEEPINHPLPLSRPHPPILIGGDGERKTLRLVAQYADACNLMAHAGPEAVARKLDVLKRHCDQLGRDFAEIEVTVLGPVPQRDGAVQVKDFLERLQNMAQVGVQHFIFNLDSVYDLTGIETIARQVLPEISN
ncbi:MAG TPA: LLM class F420-dependent oxidoreductase [Anaerolineales bacterium]